MPRPRPELLSPQALQARSHWAASFDELSNVHELGGTDPSHKEHAILHNGWPSREFSKEALELGGSTAPEHALFPLRCGWPSSAEFSNLTTSERQHSCGDLLQANLLKTLAEHQREVEAWLESKHAKLREAVIEVCRHNGQLLPLAPTPRQSHVDFVGGLPPAKSKTEEVPRKKHTFKFQKPPTTIHDGTLRSRLDVMLRGRVDTLIGMLIVLNTVIMFVELQVYGSRGIPPPSEPHELAEPAMAFHFFTHAFSTIFLLELLIKLYVYRTQFLNSLLNVVDIFIVMVTCADAWILPYVGTDLLNVSFLRVFRFVRMARALRVMRTLSLFSNLRVLVNAIFMSVASLFWSCIVLFVFIFASSLFLCQTLQDFVYDKTGDYDDRVWVDKYYGTSAKALYTVFEMTLSGCWPNYARPLIEKVNPWYAAFFALYVTVVVFAILKLISALFLKNTLNSAANDDEMVLRQKMEEIDSSKDKLRELFSHADKSGDGVLCLEELGELLSYPKVKSLMSALGLNAYTALELFDLLDDGDGMISYLEFVDGITRMQGNARSQDLLLIIRNSDSILEQCEHLHNMCRSLQLALGLPLQPPPPHRRRRFGTYRHPKSEASSAPKEEPGSPKGD